MIFQWFEKDFSAAAGSVLAYVARYVNDPELAKELGRPGYRIEFLEYDWSLNGTPPQGDRSCWCIIMRRYRSHAC